MSKITTHFVLERETKGALRFQQVTAKGNKTPYAIAEGAEVGTLYMRKSAFEAGKYPATITVEVTADE